MKIHYTKNNILFIFACYRFLHYLVQLFPLASEGDSIPASRLGNKHGSESMG